MKHLNIEQVTELLHWYSLSLIWREGVEHRPNISEKQFLITCCWNSTEQTCTYIKRRILSYSGLEKKHENKMICSFWVSGRTAASQKAFFLPCALLTESKGQKSCCSYNKIPHTPKPLELSITYGEDVKWMNSLLDTFISSIPSTHWEEPCRPRQSCRCPNLHSALIRCLIIDCGQLVKPSSCFGGPPRPPVARLLHCTSLCTAHRQGKLALLPTATRSAFLFVIVSAAAWQTSRRCSHTGRLEVEKFCSSFPCAENEPRKITTRNRFM